MPQQLIYTSAPRGLVPGRSGHCTVARSAAMREALVLRLEQLSYYHHLSLGGAAERPILAHRIIDIRGSRFHVLSRIQDAGLDFTGRTNFIAHHVAFTPEESRGLPSPPVILRDWNGWKQQWIADPQLLDIEDWSDLTALAGIDSLPAQTWKQVTGDAINAYGLLELAASVRVHGQSNETLLGLLAESLELLEVRDRRQDRRTAAWQFTFTTSLQDQDNPGDFRWRFIQADAPARLTAGEGRAIEAVAPKNCTDEEAALARLGRQAPRFIVEPQNAQVCDGETARLNGQAEGLPYPTYQWFTVDRQNNCQIIEGATNPELVLTDPPRGVSRYVLNAKNSSGEVTSAPLVLSVELRLSVVEPSRGAANPPPKSKEPYQKSAEQIEEQRQRLEAKERELRGNRRLFLGKLSLVALGLIMIAGAAILVILPRMRHTQTTPSEPPISPGAASLATYPASAPQPLALNDARRQLMPGSVSASPSSATSVKQNTTERITMARPGKVNLPPGWRAVGIGGVSHTNCEYLPDEHPPEVAMSAAGQGFGESGDNVLFVCTNSQKQLSAALGDNESSGHAGCGIMVRETNATNSPFLFIGASSDKVLVYLRDTDGNFYSKSTNRPASRMRLTIKKNNIGQYDQSCSFGSQSFTFPNFSVRLRENSLIGFALASGSASNVATARFAMADQRNGGRAIAE